MFIVALERNRKCVGRVRIFEVTISTNQNADFVASALILVITLFFAQIRARIGVIGRIFIEHPEAFSVKSSKAVVRITTKRIEFVCCLFHTE